MGCGKSSVGRELAELLSLPFVDLDGYVESREGRSVREIFAGGGEEAFRKMELDALQDILFHGDGAADSDMAGRTDGGDGRNMVLALGGGTLTTPECAELVAEHTFCIFLKASAGILFTRLENGAANRPMLNPHAGADSRDSGDVPGSAPGDIHGSSSETAGLQLRRRIADLLAQREQLYERAARLTIVTDNLSVKQAAAAIAAELW